MKKGLLSLLVLALTVVGCQNYDDQFEELTSLIEDLQTEVQGIDGVQASITSLQGTVAGLSTALGTVQSTVNGLSNYDDSAVVAQLDSVSSTLADLLAQLNGVATAADLGTISDTLAQVQADVRELLEGESTINQNISITNEATLQYAETLVSTGTDSPNVIVNGTVTVNTTNFSDDQISRTDEIVEKFATILNNVTITSTHTLDFENLAFVDANVTYTGVAPGIGSLRTISNDLTANQTLGGAVDFSQITSIDNLVVAVTNKNSITSVNLGNAQIASVKVGEAGVAANTIDAPKAGSVNTGNAPVIAIIATSATNVDHNYSGSAALASLAITAQPNSENGTVDVIAAKVTAGITITGTDTLIVHLDNLTTDNAFTMGTKVGELHLPKVKNASGAINAKVAALPEFLAQSAALDISATNPNLPKADSTTGTGVLTLSGTGAATMKNMNAALVANAITSLTVTELKGNVGFPATMAELSTLNLTGKVETAAVPSTQVNSITISGLASLTTVSLDGAFKNVTSDGNAKMTSLTTAGGIVSLIVTGATKLATANIGHNHINGNDAATLVFTGSALPSLDLSAVSKVASLTVSGNSKLESLTAPSTTVLAEAGAAVGITIGVNSMTATWQQYVPGIPATGTTPAIPAVPAELQSNGLATIQTLINAYKNTQTASPTFSLDSFVVSGTSTYANFGAATAADAYVGTNSGTINTFPELDLITTE